MIRVEGGVKRRIKQALNFFLFNLMVKCQASNTEL